MSQSVTVDKTVVQVQSEDSHQEGSLDQQLQNFSIQTEHRSSTSCKSDVDDLSTKKIDKTKSDVSNGFENRTLDHERFVTLDRNQIGQVNPQQLQQTRVPLQYPSIVNDLPAEYTNSSQHPVIYPTLRRSSMVGQQEERHSIVNQQLSQQYPDKTSLDRVQYVSQTGTQTAPVQSQPHFASEYVTDQSPQYTQICGGQFEVRSQIYSQQQQQQQQQQQPREYGDRGSYVTRDVTYREQTGTALYSHQQNSVNPIFTGTGPYVTVQHPVSQLSSQSVSPQPSYYTSVVVPSQGASGYSSFVSTGQPQYPYSQYPQTVMNPIPYNPHGSLYQAQQFPQQSPNPQRFSQDMSQYQSQPIIQPIAQNVITVGERSGARGPKPMVPPRGNSKITHSDHRKSLSIDVAGQKSTVLPPNPQNPQSSHESILRNDQSLLLTTSQVANDGQERRFLSPINQNPRTRQDGLYVDSNGEQIIREKSIDPITTDCGLYASRSEHRKSVSVDVTTSFQRRNDTITFTFPGDNNQQDTTTTGRKTVSLNERQRTDNQQVFPIEPRRVESIVRVSPMNFDQRQENRKINERKVEWSNVSPNQRNSGTISSQDNRRSDYFEEHRRSPMNMDSKRVDDVRRSPMPFVPIRDTSNDRAAQKSPSFVNQNFEKTRQELAMWAEQRQRQELERGIHSNQIFSSSPRSRNQSEERRDQRTILTADEMKKDARLSQIAFQPISNITQSSIMEQRRHLRHVSADLTKHMELSRKDFDDQPITGSVANLVPLATNSVSSQRSSPNICHQYPALSEVKLDSKTLPLTIVTDFSDNQNKSVIENSDHIIHSHRKSHNNATNLLTRSKSQAENIQVQTEICEEKTDVLDTQQQQQQQQHQQLQNQQMQNQQSLDIISEKLSQFEKQQSDLQAKLQCLQNQNEILDKVAKYQHQQSDLQVRFQCLQERQVGEKTLREATEYQPMGLVNDLHKIQLNPMIDDTIEKINENVAVCSDQQHQSINRQSIHSIPTYVTSQILQNQVCQSLTCDKLSPRLNINESMDSNVAAVSQNTLSGNSQFERNDGARSSLQYRLPCPSDILENVLLPNVSSASNVNVGTIAAGGNFTGTLKKVPPEKPPRTSLIVQSPESESNRSQPAIGLKQTPKTRVSTTKKKAIILHRIKKKE